LWVRDCGYLTRDDPACRDPKVHDPRTQFSKNDAEKVATALASRRVDEVWLFSGGGDSNEGFRVGEVLRRYQVTVRVPHDAFCASACTVAFMGGFFRYIDVDQGARYLVHSASKWRNGLGDDDDYVELIRKDPSKGLLAYASVERVLARFSARRRLRHFQQTLLLPVGGGEAYAETDAALSSWAQNAPPLEYEADQLAADVRRISSEGDPAIQDLLMRIERDSMRLALRDLRSTVGRLGARAEPALRMIEVMFQTGILETATLTPQTLIQMGFVTKDLDKQ